MASPHPSHRWVATLIVLLLLAQAGHWAWRKVQQLRQQPLTHSARALSRKIAASMAYDLALAQADSLLARNDTAAVRPLLDSLRQLPTDSLFPIERQKLQKLQERLGRMQKAARPGPLPD